MSKTYAVETFAEVFSSHDTLDIARTNMMTRLQSAGFSEGEYETAVIYIPAAGVYVFVAAAIPIAPKDKHEQVKVV